MWLLTWRHNTSLCRNNVVDVMRLPDVVQLLGFAHSKAYFHLAQINSRG